MGFGTNMAADFIKAKGFDCNFFELSALIDIPSDWLFHPILLSPGDERPYAYYVDSSMI